jgi:hypothetical protein
LVVEGAKSAGLLKPGGQGGLDWVRGQSGVVFIGMTTLAIMANMHEHLGKGGLSYPPGSDYLWSLPGASDEAKATATEAVVLKGDPESRWGMYGTLAVVGVVTIGGLLIVRRLRK